MQKECGSGAALPNHPFVVGMVLEAPFAKRPGHDVQVVELAALRGTAGMVAPGHQDHVVVFHCHRHVRRPVLGEDPLETEALSRVDAVVTGLFRVGAAMLVGDPPMYFRNDAMSSSRPPTWAPYRSTELRPMVMASSAWRLSMEPVPISPIPALSNSLTPWRPADASRPFTPRAVSARRRGGRRAERASRGPSRRSPSPRARRPGGRGPGYRKESLFDGSNLTDYEKLAGYIFFTATGEEFEPGKLERETWFIGRSKLCNVFLIYAPDVEKLKEMALTLELARKLPRTKRSKLVFAPTKYLDPEFLHRYRITFQQLPFQIYEAADRLDPNLVRLAGQ